MLCVSELLIEATTASEFPWLWVIPCIYFVRQKSIIVKLCEYFFFSLFGRGISTISWAIWSRSNDSVIRPQIPKVIIVRRNVRWFRRTNRNCRRFRLNECAWVINALKWSDRAISLRPFDCYILLGRPMTDAERHYAYIVMAYIPNRKCQDTQAIDGRQSPEVTME